MPGLYAAGDAATRELICGGFTGGGSHNAAWAISSGSFAGRGAADYALRRRPGSERPIRRAGTIGLRAAHRRALDPAWLARAVQDEVYPYDINYFRHADRLDASLGRLDHLWRQASAADSAAWPDLIKTRESAAMLATARWMYRSALARNESRGMHWREDRPQPDARQRHYVTTAGLDDIWTATSPHAGGGLVEAAE